MSYLNPSDSTEVIYGSSGDVRNEINAYMQVTTAGHYADENEIPGSLITTSLRKATRLINSYLVPVFADQIPFTTIPSVPKQLEEISSDMATYFTLRSASAKVGPIDLEKKRDYYDAYMDPVNGILVMLRDRKIQLSELLTTGYGDDVKASRQQNRSPIFDVDDEKNARVDPDLLNDIQQDRDL